MKYVLSLCTGLLLGVLVAFALILFNPLTLSQSDPLNDPEWVLSYALSADHTWLSTHDDSLEIPIVPKDVPLLWENGIKRGIIAAMPLEATTGSPSAAGTRISFPSPETELLHSGLVVEDHWLISVPGAGTFFVHATSNQWPLLRDTVVRVDWLKRSWAGPGKYDVTRGPANAGAEVFGLTGTFQGTRGHARERLSLDSYAGSLDPLTGQLMIKLGNSGG
jgi:hypothetical protein